VNEKNVKEGNQIHNFILCLWKLCDSILSRFRFRKTIGKYYFLFRNVKNIESEVQILCCNFSANLKSRRVHKNIYFECKFLLDFVPGISAHEHLQVIHAPLFLVSQYAVGSIYFHKLKKKTWVKICKILLSVKKTIVKYIQADTNFKINFIRKGVNKGQCPSKSDCTKTGTGT